MKSITRVLVREKIRGRNPSKATSMFLRRLSVSTEQMVASHIFAELGFNFKVKKDMETRAKVFKVLKKGWEMKYLYEDGIMPQATFEGAKHVFENEIFRAIEKAKGNSVAVLFLQKLQEYNQFIIRHNMALEIKGAEKAKEN